MTHRLTKRIGLGLLIIGVSGLGLAYAAAQKPFSHAPHLAEKMACADCHDAAKEPMAIKKEGCAKCHGDAPLAYGQPASAPRPLRAPFPHARHAAALSCTDCHQGLEKDALPQGRPFMNYAQCQSCHKDNDIATPAGKCTSCHNADPRKAKPLDHGQAWKTRHGAAADWRVFETHGTDCALLPSARKLRRMPPQREAAESHRALAPAHARPGGELRPRALQNLPRGRQLPKLPSKHGALESSRFLAFHSRPRHGCGQSGRLSRLPPAGLRDLPSKREEVSMRNALHIAGPLVLSLLFLGCGGTKLADGLEDSWSLSSRYHPAGYAAAAVHGPAFLSSRTNLPTRSDSSQCANCHGQDLSGGTSGRSCGECHAQKEKWVSDCTFCHGGKEDQSGAPPRALDGSTERTSPRVGAHQAHVKASDTHPAFDCETCHIKPYDIFTLTHLDGKVEVIFPADGRNARATFTNNGCQNTYCHGGGQNGPAFNDPTPLNCHSCHGDATQAQKLSGAHAIHLRYDLGCDDCHGSVKANGASGYQFVAVAQHLNGQADVALRKGRFDAAKKSCAATCHADERSWFSK